jgi:WD40 repeat protein
MIRSIKTNDSVISLAVLPNGYLASGSADGSSKIWNTDDGSLVINILAHILFFSSWNTGEPNNAGEDENNLKEDCLQITPTGLNDISCSAQTAFICEMNL